MANLNSESDWMQLQVVHREEVASDVVFIQLRPTSVSELPVFDVLAWIERFKRLPKFIPMPGIAAA